jgi:hypothetical protein
VQGRKARAFVDYYLGVRLHQDGSFASWYRIRATGSVT